MAMTFDTAVDRAQTLAPEVPQATIVSFANARLNRMVAEADYRRKVTTIATTVSGQAAYDIPSDVIDIRAISISDAPYERVGYQVVRDLRAGRRWLTGDGGVFAPYDNTTGTPQVYIWPTPATSGDAIEAEESYQGADVTYGASNTTILPAHFLPALVDGTLADVYDFQGREDMAQKYEDRFEASIERLRRYKNSRVGSGPAKLTVTARNGS